MSRLNVGNDYQSFRNYRINSTVGNRHACSSSVGNGRDRSEEPCHSEVKPKNLEVNR